MKQRDDLLDERRVTAVQGYFRDLMGRTIGWRDRLDRTANWAVVLVATLLTWAFSRPEHPHFVILVAVAGVSFFLATETRRYRKLDVWRSRVRRIERDILAPLFDPELEARAEVWRDLAADLVSPSLKVPYVEALQRRLRHMQGALIYLLIVAWVLKLTAVGADDPVRAAAVGPVPGLVVVTLVGLFVGAVTVLIVWPIERRAMERIDCDDDARDGDWQELDGPEAHSANV